ncbi:MAG: LPXTG cell wall anchor domain-containing protein [Candidatus Paceibacterota bacterium]
MQNIITQGQGILLLVVYGLLMIAVTFFVSRKRRKDTSEFLLADRGVGIFVGAMSIAAAWILGTGIVCRSSKIV